MIQYNVDVDDLRQIENALGMSKNKSKQILKSAINSTEKETTSFCQEKLIKDTTLRKQRLTRL